MLDRFGAPPYAMARRELLAWVKGRIRMSIWIKSFEKTDITEEVLNPSHMTPAQQKEWANAQLRIKAKELGRMPRKSDFQDIEIIQIRVSPGPRPRAMAAMCCAVWVFDRKKPCLVYRTCAIMLIKKSGKPAFAGLFKNG